MIKFTENSMDFPAGSEAAYGYEVMRILETYNRVKSDSLQLLNYIDKENILKALRQRLESIKAGAIINGVATTDEPDPPFCFKGYLLRDKVTGEFYDSSHVYFVYKSNQDIDTKYEPIPVYIIRNAERSEAGEPKPNIQS